MIKLRMILAADLETWVEDTKAQCVTQTPHLYAIEAVNLFRRVQWPDCWTFRYTYAPSSTHCIAPFYTIAYTVCARCPPKPIQVYYITGALPPALGERRPLGCGCTYPITFAAERPARPRAFVLGITRAFSISSTSCTHCSVPCIAFVAFFKKRGFGLMRRCSLNISRARESRRSVSSKFVSSSSSSYICIPLVR